MLLLPWEERQNEWWLFDTEHLLIASIVPVDVGFTWTLECRDVSARGATVLFNAAKEEIEDLLRSQGHSFLTKKLVCMV